MTSSRAVSLLLLAAASAALANASPRGVPCTAGPLVSASVEIDGEETPLYPAPDRSGRYYLEAREGRRYSVTLANRSGERLGVVLTVDGLNVISGNRGEGRGRMYVLDPWQRTSVRGWRTSLQEVRAFTFVDERTSYAARSGKANRKMGWIEVAVYREHRVAALRAPEPVPSLPEPKGEREGRWPAREETLEEARSADAKAQSSADAGAGGRSYPGTGWGRRAHDPAMLVSFEPEAHPSQSVALRYEYRPALVALGVLPRRPSPDDRLRQRDQAEAGFAQPPMW